MKCVSARAVKAGGGASDFSQPGASGSPGWLLRVPAELACLELFEGSPTLTVKRNNEVLWQKRALESAANGIVVTDRQANVLWSNPAFTLLTGYSAPEISGRNMRVFKSNSHDSRFYAGMWRTILKGGIWQGEVVNRRKNGSYFVQDQTIAPVINTRGEVDQFVAIQHDITLRKIREAALRESESRFRSLADATDEGIVIYQRGRIVEINSAVTALFGYERAELVGQSVLALSDPGSRDLVKRNLARPTSRYFDMTGLTKDRLRLAIRVQRRRGVYRGQSARVLGLREIQPRRGARARAPGWEGERALDAERTRLARDMHDELGASLTRITVLSELLERGALEPAKIASHAQLISRTSRELAKRMDEIVWAIDPAKDRLENLGSYLMAYAEEFLSLVNLRCRFELPPVLPDLRLSSRTRHCLFLAVKEALNNVVKHAGATEVQLSLGVRGRELTIEVRDNGCGFELATRSTRGSGLNNLRSRLAEAGGVCLIQSGRGRGTCVRMVVPGEFSSNKASGFRGARAVSC